MVPLITCHLPYKVTLSLLKGWPYKKWTTYIQFTSTISTTPLVWGLAATVKNVLQTAQNHINTQTPKKHPHTHPYIHTHAHTHARTHARAHARTHARTHTHTHTHTRIDGKGWEGIVRDGKGWPPNFQPISGRRRCDFPVLQQ